VRFLHAFHGEATPTLPLALVDSAARLVRAARPAPARRADRVTLDGDELTIASSELYDWDALTIVRYDARLWRVRDRRRAGGAWPHVQVLEPAPAEHVVRRIVDYPPRD
jgi:hypothetical protein